MTGFLHQTVGALAQVLACALLVFSIWRVGNPRLRFVCVDSGAMAITEVSVRFCALAYLLFEVTSLFAGFKPAVVLACAVVLALSATLSIGDSRNAGEISARARPSRSTTTMLGTLSIPSRIALALPASLVVLAFLRVTAAPPLAWDDLTYHLVKSASFVQSGGLTRATGTDAWSYYAFVPHGGEAIWSFFMLFTRSDVLVPVASIAATLVAGAATTVLSTEFGAKREAAFLAGAFVIVTPSVLRLAGTGYIDNLLLAFWLSALAFAMRFMHTADLQDGITAATAGTMAAAVKLPGVSVAVLVFLVVTLCAVRQRESLSLRAPLLLLLATALGACGYVRTWIQTGSPVYPLSLEFGGISLFQGNALWVETLAMSSPAATHLQRLVYLMFGTANGSYLGLGVGALLLPLLGLAALPTLWRRGLAQRVGLLVALLSTTSLAWGLFLSDHRALLDVWAPVSGRLLAPIVAVLAAAVAAGPGARVALLTLTLLQALHGFPRPDAMESLPASGVAVIAAFAIAGLVASTRSRYAARFRIVAIVAVLAVGTATLQTWRSWYRHSYYREARADTLSIRLPHPLAHRYVAAEAWQFVDQDVPLTIAHAAGFDGIGHNWYRYPLFGSRLQNRVVWVSPGTNSEEDFSYVSSAPVDEDSWTARLDQANVDFVVLTPPEPPEVALAEHGCRAGTRVMGAAVVVDRSQCDSAGVAR